MAANNDIWVTYVTEHPTGFKYYGKSSERRIQAGYQGSGPRLKCAFLHPAFAPSTWTTTILSRHLNESLAFLAEEKLVPLDLLKDPFCLNTQPGGNKRFYGSAYSQLLKRSKVKTKKITLSRDGTVTIKVKK